VYNNILPQLFPSFSHKIHSLYPKAWYNERKRARKLLADFWRTAKLLSGETTR
jgi:hypothetical protein